MKIIKELELWADSFHEGDWACTQLAEALKAEGVLHRVEYRNGFFPVHKYEGEDLLIELFVYGSYRSWKPIPNKINSLLDWGKPDFLVYDKANDKILFAVEETAAVPTGNQALQRCERMYGSARIKIPFWYLISEFGIHKDGNIRRDSIWPTVMALKATKGFRTPVVVLHYSDAENPESYISGFGLRSLFDILGHMIINDIKGQDLLDGTYNKLKDQYTHMIDFVESQWSRMLDYLPGHACFSYQTLSEEYSKYAIAETPEKQEKSTDSFLVWPTVNNLPDKIRLLQKGKALIKYDKLCSLLERDVDHGKAYCLSNNAGSRPQKEDKIKTWIKQQEQLFLKGKHLAPGAEFSMKIEDFPPSQNGNFHVTTSKNIVFLYDRWDDLKKSIENAYPRLAGRLLSDGNITPVFLYISNSLKPGRIFGDPFTGQIAAYALAFGIFDKPRRKVVAYFPHQCHTQACQEMGKGNKGLTLMKELTDLLIFTGGVGVYLKTGEVV